MSWLAALALALAPAPAPPVQAPRQAADVDWAEVWSELAAARARSELVSTLAQPGLTQSGLTQPANAARLAEADERLQALEDLARAQRSDPRGALLAAQLERHFDPKSQEPLLLPPSPDARPYQGPELWLAVEVMVPGPERTALAVEALRTERVTQGQVRLAYELSTEDGLALRLRDARALQEALHANQQADWSALNYAHSLRLLGLALEADRVLAAQLERSADPAALWNQRGLIALGRGREREARGYLGRALALGSSNAGVVLGRLALDAGQLAEARAHFRALVTTPDAGAWALRGWGLAQLPAREARLLVPHSEAPGTSAPDGSQPAPAAPLSNLDR